MAKDLPDDQEADQEMPVHTWSFDSDSDALQIYRAEFAGQRDSLSVIRELAEEAANSTPLGEVAVAGFEMAVDELCANVVEHGYEKDDEESPRPMLIEIARFPDRIECIVTDYSAIHFAVDKASTRGFASFLQEQRERGLGLDIIRHCVDQVEHQWLQPKGNQTRLVKFYDAGPDGEL